MDLKDYGKHYSRKIKKILDERDTRRLVLNTSKTGKNARSLQKAWNLEQVSELYREH